MKASSFWLLLCVLVIFSCQEGNKNSETDPEIIRELNQAEIRPGERIIARVERFALKKLQIFYHCCPGK